MSASFGALGEDVCGGCGARFLDATIVEHVREAFLRIDAALLRELASAGTKSAPCPRCATSLRVHRVRGVDVDLCPGCGGALLDAGELLAWSRGMVEEVRSAPALRGEQPHSAADSAAEADEVPWHGVRWIVACTSCDRELDLATTTWAVNDRPWCGACVEAHGLGTWRHLFALTVGSVFGVLLWPFEAMLEGRRGRNAPGPLAPSWLRWREHVDLGVVPVVRQVSPEEAGPAFARFVRRAR